MKIKCPAHEDVNPSMHVYGEYAWCFVCGHRDRTDNVAQGIEVDKTPTVKEDIAETYKYINSLGKINIRGLEFPADEKGFYITWPYEEFYKKRLFEGKSRYVGPKGHKPPLYKRESVFKYRMAVIIEGELNAESLWSAPSVMWDVDILSPGSATEMSKHLYEYLTNYDIFAIVVDKDIPGVVNGVRLRDELLRNKKKVQLIAVEKDINEILQEKGKEGVQAWAKENLDMLRGL